MSERSELQQHGAFFGAKRRSVHWCTAEIDPVKDVHESMVHQ